MHLGLDQLDRKVHELDVDFYIMAKALERLSLRGQDEELQEVLQQERGLEDLNKDP